jgi:diacylglycerol kinase family enzyme
MSAAMQGPRTTPGERLREAMGWRPVPRPERPVLFINPRSGGGTAARLALEQRAQDLGIEPVVLAPGQDLAPLVGQAIDLGADALGMAGGDGSMALVAAAASAAGLPFVCVPAGTRNHFARDVGVLRHDVAGALEAFTDGLERTIDIGEVNGRPFVDNVILGFYGDAIRQEGYRDARMRTLLATAREALGPRAPASGLTVGDDRGREYRDAAVVLVSNNPYAVGRTAAVETRPRLDSGRLGVVVLERPGARRAHHAWTATSLELGAQTATHAGLDGEAVVLAPPLRFSIRPRALRVRICARHPGASPSAQLTSLDPRRITKSGRRPVTRARRKLAP